MPTIAEIKEKYQKIHDELTGRYYVMKEMDRESFLREHEDCWADFDKEIIEASDFAPPSVEISEMAALKERVAELESMIAILSH